MESRISLSACIAVSTEKCSVYVLVSSETMYLNLYRCTSLVQSGCHYNVECRSGDLWSTIPSGGALSSPLTSACGSVLTAYRLHFCESLLVASGTDSAPRCRMLSTVTALQQCCSEGWQLFIAVELAVT